MNELIVAAPSKYANAQLNGARVLVLHDNAELQVTTALIVSGAETGRAWQFDPSHLRAVNGEER